MMPLWTPQLTDMLTALPHPLNRFHALPRLLPTIGSNKRHSGPYVDTHPGVPFILVQHAWHFERRAFIFPNLSEYVSRSACLSGQ